MAVDVTLLNSSSLTNIQTNFERVATALQETLGRGGDTPNHMNADLDMNSNDVLNVNRIDVQEFYMDGQPIASIPAFEGLEEIIPEIVTVAGIADDVIVVADNEAEIETVVNNLPAIVDAPNQAAAAAASAIAAQNAATSLMGMMATGIQGRLSLVSGVPSSPSDVSGGTNIFYVPSSGQYASVYNGTTFVSVTIGSQLTLPLNSNAGHAGYHAINNNFDLFIINDSGTPRLVSGPSWTVGAVAGSDVARGTGANSTELETFNGVLVNKNSFTVRFGTLSGDTLVIPARRATYVGSFRASGNGEATDSKLKRFLFNAYNRLERDMRVNDPTANWVYSSATIRQARANTGNQIEFLHGLSGILVEANLFTNNSNTLADGSTYFTSGIGLDSTTTFATDSNFASAFFLVAARSVEHCSMYRGYPGLGYHRLVWLESATNGATTWFGNDYKCGMTGRFLG